MKISKYELDVFKNASLCRNFELEVFKNLENKYLHTVSWNEKVEGDFISSSVKQFFAKGEGLFWYHKADFHNLPYVEYNGPEVDTDINLDEDLQYTDSKFYGDGQCKSLKQQPVLPTIEMDEIKNKKIKPDKLKQSTIYTILKLLHDKNEIYRKSGAVHGCAICDDKKIIDFIDLVIEKLQELANAIISFIEYFKIIAPMKFGVVSIILDKSLLQNEKIPYSIIYKLQSPRFFKQNIESPLDKKYFSQSFFET